MSDQLIDIRTALAESANVRVEMGRDGVLHVLTGPVTIHLDRGRCEELARTLARAVAVLGHIHPRDTRPSLSLVREAAAGDAQGRAGSGE